MQWTNARLLLASVFTISFGSILVKAANETQKGLPKLLRANDQAPETKVDFLTLSPENPLSSRMLLGRFMENPILHRIYLDKQLNSLTHPVDRALRSFFLSDPRLESIYRAILKNQEAFLQDFERYADVTMHRLARGVTKTYDRLDHLVEETSRDLGFSPEAIANRRIYIKEGSGSINAFTVSGSQDKIIVVVHSTLLEKMDEFEVRAVLGHELGHIRASHPVNGMLLDSMFTLVLRTFTQGDITVPAPNERGLVNFSKLCSDGSMIGENGTKSRITMDYVDSMLGNTFKNRRINAFNSLVNGVVQVFLKIPETEREQLLQRFLNLTVGALAEMNAPEDAVAFFRELSEQLPKAGLIKVDAKQLADGLSVVDEAISRAQESSADRFGSSVSKNEYLASSMGKLLGIAFANENRQGVLKSLLKQAEEFYQNVSEKERAYYMGGSHPVPVLRTHMIMNFSPLPDIFFANPFISLLILEDGAVEMLEMFKRIPEVNMAKLVSANNQVDPSIAIEQQLETVDAAIVDHLMITEQKLREGRRNPRFDNMLQFFLVNKENLFEKKESLNALLSEALKAKDKNEIRYLTMDIQETTMRLETMGQQILKKTSEAMVALAKSKAISDTKRADLELRQKQISLALTSIDSRQKLSELRALRMEMTTLPGNRTKGSRIPIECRLFTY
ncbi:MAG: hypothetical protein RJB66_1863 [Pseudomonadota bacterium]